MGVQQLLHLNSHQVAPQALKEVYLPECGVWVSDYPFLIRLAFLDLSLEIERERRAHTATP